MGRLFWKIFSWFWVALVLLNLGVGWGVKLYYSQLQESDDKLLQARVGALARSFEAGNYVQARELLTRTRSSGEPKIFVINDSGKDIFERPLPPFLHHPDHDRGPVKPRILEREVNLPNGTHLKLLALPRPSWLRSFRNTPIWIVLSITLIISTLVCYWLARYLSSPVQRLTTATRQLAGGDLDVRVGTINRRDEIADLAVDFDRMADKIQQLLGSQKQLLQDISHELRSPLARLQVALALVMRNNSGNANDYQRIARDLDRLEELIGEVLTLSRLDTITYTRENVDIQELVTAIVEDCSLEATERNCQIHCQSSENLSLDGSPELLRRAIENVLRNAVKFTRPDSSIQVIAEKIAENIVISVRDEGPGIPESDADKMFEAFVRIDSARSHKPGGYGLGLAIARKAIELHGGTISASNNPTEGLTVTITLPA